MEKQEANKKKRVFNLIIVDESGSMSCIHKQAFSGMNETLQTIRQMQEKFPRQEQYVTLLTFDSDHMTWHYDKTPASATTDLDWNAYNPCGCTPLYDAMGVAISKVNAQVREEDNVLVTVITDGEENNSHEWTLRMIKTLIGKLKKQHWTFTLIGTDNLDVEGMARSFSIDEHLKFRQNENETQAMFCLTNRCMEKYNLCLDKNESLPTGTYFDE